VLDDDIKVDTPIPAPGGGVTIGAWAIDPDWKLEHLKEYTAALGFIKEDEAAPDLKAFLKKFPPPVRAYVTQRPRTAKPLPEGIELPESINVDTEKQGK
jgi:hypothetical protein